MFIMYQKFTECGALKHTDVPLMSISLIGAFSSVYKAISHAVDVVEKANESYREGYSKEDVDDLFGSLKVEASDEGFIILSCKAIKFVIREFVVDKPEEVTTEYIWYVDKKEVK